MELKLIRRSIIALKTGRLASTCCHYPLTTVTEGHAVFVVPD